MNMNQENLSFHINAYILLEDWALECHQDTDITVFCSYKEASDALKSTVEEELKGSFANWVKEDNFTEIKGNDSYECYLDDDYCANHYKICIQTKQLQLPASLSKRVFSKCRRSYFLEDFEKQIEGWEEISELTEEQYAQMVSDPLVALHIRQRLQKNDIFLEAYWQTVSEVAHEHVQRALLLCPPSLKEACA